MRAALVLALLATAASAQTPVTEAQAHAAVPRADLSGLSDPQRAVFLEAAADLFDYAGCQDTLAKCLAAGQTDAHALRMASLVRQLAHEGFPPTTIVQVVEGYYQSFGKKQRKRIATDDCALLGRGPVTVIEFSDYQCPHCAAAVKPLRELVLQDRKGVARLCSKFFPFPSHPEAHLASACVEFAAGKGKRWEMHELVFAHQDALKDAQLKEYAASLHLDGDKMLKEAYAGKYDALIARQVAQGLEAGVQSTPTLFIVGRGGLAREVKFPTSPWYLQFAVDDEVQWEKEKGWKFAESAARSGAPSKTLAKGK